MARRQTFKFSYGFALSIFARSINPTNPGCCDACHTESDESGGKLGSRGLRPKTQDPSDRSGLNIRIVAEPPEANPPRLSTEPCHLALGVIAVALLGGLNGLLATEFSAEDLARLFVAERG